MSDKRDDYLSKGMERLEKTVDKVDEKCDHIDKNLSYMSARFEDHLIQDEKMYEEFKKMNSVLQENTESLKDHVARTNLLQETVIQMNLRLEPIEQERLKKQAVAEYRNGVLLKWGKILGLIATGVAIVAGIAKLIWGIG